MLKCVPLSLSFADEGKKIHFILRRKILYLRFFYLVPWNEEPIPLYFTAVFKENKEAHAWFKNHFYFWSSVDPTFLKPTSRWDLLP